MKTILIIHQSAEMYGSDKTLLLFLTGMDKLHFRAVVLLPSEGPLKTELEKEGIKVVIAPVLKLYRKMFTPRNIITFLKDIRAGLNTLDTLHKAYGFDIVYSNTLAVLLGMFFAKRRKIKHIWHVHEIIVHPKLFANGYPYLLDRFADVVVCNSNATKDNLVTRRKSLAKKCVVVYNGLDKNNDIEEIGLTREALGYSPTDTIITLIGRISRLKGHKWVLNTYMAHLNKSSIKLLFVGSPVTGQEYYLEEIEQFIQCNNLYDNVAIIPFTKNLKQVWSVTDIALMPSTEPESFGMVALEAMLEKKPVVASAHGGLTEIVADGQTGFLVKPSDKKELADAILRLVNDPELAHSIGEQGYQRALSRFSLQKYVAEMSKIFT